MNISRELDPSAVLFPLRLLILVLSIVLYIFTYDEHLGRGSRGGVGGGIGVG